MPPNIRIASAVVAACFVVAVVLSLVNPASAPALVSCNDSGVQLN
jgi:hypothetical protein